MLRILIDDCRPCLYALGIALALLFLLNIPSAVAFYLSGKFWGRADKAPQG